MTAYVVDDGPKMLRETLSVAQAAILDSRFERGPMWAGQALLHAQRLQRLIDECERLRPTGPDGKHGKRHTPWCGCEE